MNLVVSEAVEGEDDRILVGEDKETAGIFVGEEEAMFLMELEDEDEEETEGSARSSSASWIE